MFHTELLIEPLAQGLYPIAFGGMVTTGKIVHAGFPGKVGGGLGNLAAQVGIHPPGLGLVDKALGATGTPADGFNLIARVAHMQRGASQHGFRVSSELRRRHGTVQAPHIADRPRRIIQSTLHSEPQTPGKLGVIAQGRVGIQGKVIGKQIDIVAQQGLQALLFHAANPLILTFPEITMVNQNGIRFFHDRRIDQGLAGGDPADHTADLFAAFHLQSIGTVVLKVIRSQLLVEQGQHVIALEHDTYRAMI